MENFALLPHRLSAYHRALQVGWSRFRAVLMLIAFYLKSQPEEMAQKFGDAALRTERRWRPVAESDSAE